MAAKSGAIDPPVAATEASTANQRLWERPFEFDFFQAVRLLQRERGQPVGSNFSPGDEAVRFAAHPSMTFPASAAQSLARQEDKPPLMTVNFMGLTGPLGVLPLVYTELVRQRILARDSTLRDFFDLFNHRAISLFYRAWEKYRHGVPYERGEPDPFTQYLRDLIGLGTRGLADRQNVSDESLLFYAGLLGQRPRSSSALRQILEDYFDVPVEIEQFQGAWRKLEFDSQCSMEDTGRPSGQLGIGAVLGAEVWDQQSVVRIRLGPLHLDQYLDFLPTGTAYGPMCALTRFFSNELDFEVQLILKRTDAPPCDLGAEGNVSPKLGWLTWMKNVPLERDPGDTLLQLWKTG